MSAEGTGPLVSVFLSPDSLRGLKLLGTPGLLGKGQEAAWSDFVIMAS